MPPVTSAPATLILPGAPLRDALLLQVKAQLAAQAWPVHTVIVQVGANPASTLYIANKLKACAAVGITAEVLHLTESDGEAALHSTLRALAQDASVTAVIVQTPLPAGWDVQAALDAVPRLKDIDGLSSANMSLRRSGSVQALLPATPLGIVRLLAHAGVTPEGQHIAVIGQGRVVGKPLGHILAQRGAQVTVIDKSTPTPSRLASTADILVAAAGAPGLVTESWVKPGAVVIDVGLTRVDGKLVGDVARMRVEGIARILTPSPGGVGPLTVASLLTNMVDAARLQHGLAGHNWVIPRLEERPQGV